ncbi:dipeptide ABC transporter ATP-binding protein [Propioniciclava soli]|uniref:ABC transporter ATP-binding protein n=1 Tax=Propioniciclava soli TaxID=2775081 RepID=A0ABZ3C520_9ACTN
MTTAPGAYAPTPTRPVLTATGVTVTFPGVRAADAVSLTAVPGRVVALLGESGSGKSVTAMGLVGLAPGAATVSGSAELADGTELIGAPRPVLDAVRGARVAAVFQEPMRALNPLLTIGAQFRLALAAHRRMSAAAARDRAVTLLGQVGLGADAGAVADAAGAADAADAAGAGGGATSGTAERVLASYPHELSGGQVQRVCIALALANEPEVLLADEPTTALDVTVQAQILDLLRDLARAGMAVILITHDMGVVADIADDVVIMREGVIVERGAVGDIFAHPEHPYTRMLLDAVPRLGAGLVDHAVDAAAVADAEPVATRPPTGPAEPAASAPVVALTDLTVTYTRRGRRPFHALDHVDLRIDAGEVVGLVGESGSGKSTLANVVTSLQPPTSGEVRILGQRLDGLAPAERRRIQARTGIVFQDPAGSLNPRATIGASIAEPLVLHADLGAAARAERVAELLRLVELDPALAGRFPHEMSGGQRQRVAIARAIALDPALVVADEPTSALDVSVQAAVLEMFLALQRRLGFACLFISHDLAVVEEVSTRVYVLHAGRVVEAGPTSRVLLDPQDPYTRDLIAAVPVPDPARQAERRAARHAG